MLNDRKSVVSGKSNDVPEDAAVNVATSTPSPFAGNACTVADAEAPAPEYRSSILSTALPYSGECSFPLLMDQSLGNSPCVKSAYSASAFAPNTARSATTTNAMRHPLSLLIIFFHPFISYLPENHVVNHPMPSALLLFPNGLNAAILANPPFARNWQIS